jgi:iron complex transport system ATP-binding protein
MRVFDYVLLGRTAHLNLLATESSMDLDITNAVIKELVLEEFRDRDVATLSGGERQRVTIARALAQASPIILLDEPTTALDVGYQQEVLELIDRLRREQKIAVVTTMHDLTVSGLYADQLMLLSHGEVVGSGPASEVLTVANIANYYGAEVQIIENNGRPIVVPIRTKDNTFSQ